MKVRRLASGKAVAVHSNHGLRKRCACGRRRWTGCDHDWHFSFKWVGTHHRMTLEAATGKRITAKADALAAADVLRAAIRAGTFQRPTAAPVPVPPVSAPGELTFRAFADTWLERARDGKVANAPSERSYIARLCLIALGDGETLGERAIGRITEHDIESAMEAVKARGLSASSRNHYLQAVQSLQKWGLRKGYLQRPWLSDATVNGEEVTTTSDMTVWAEAAGLKLQRSVPKIVFGLYSVMNDEKILIFEKER